jgi:predicted RNA binding protein YcfA (HicA-like mRNA interferase family)
MGNWRKTLERLMTSQSDANIGYDEICQLLSRLGYVSKHSGSHNIFRKPGFDLINLQNSGGKAKSYQVRQVREQLRKQGIL